MLALLCRRLQTSKVGKTITSSHKEVRNNVIDFQRLLPQPISLLEIIMSGQSEQRNHSNRNFVEFIVDVIKVI